MARGKSSPAPAPDGERGSVTHIRESDTYLRAVYLDDIDLPTTRKWMLEMVRLAREDGVRRILLDVDKATPDFPPSALIEEVEHFADHAPTGMKIAYVSEEMRIARHFMMIRAAAFAKGLEVDVFGTQEDAEKWLGV
ncbi:hypothetical protein [Hyphobacterium marinum]|uniref:STAS/SEC14 domain-containing protein n=1 Tax=Hyphobacterium marinum TaxID=3116574 RepID=A0ABU7LUK0_9PROT|nr:hypothetical protein [Hyphobacterium sp. Y6023]MEE2565233.1 hypothetical protein [Hyphobacterium sp. Y6023]